MNPADGGLGITVLDEEASRQHKSSLHVTQPHVEAITNQCRTMGEISSEETSQEVLKSSNRRDNNEARKQKITRIDECLSADTKRLIEQARDKGASSWLNALPIEEAGFSLNKEEFRDALRLRYNLKIENLPSSCPCGKPFNETHALSCAKGGFVHERHDNIKNMLTTLLSTVCKDVMAEPHLITLTSEVLHKKTANRSEGARLDIKAKSFWQHGQTAFFDVRVTHVNSKTQQQKDTKTIFRNHEQEKKREYLERILQVENGSMTPLVFGTNGGLGEECQRFLQHLAKKICAKSGEEYSHVITWIRTRLSFEILRSSISCLRGSRVPFRRNHEEEMCDFELKNIHGNLMAI